jgi:hypothetical protein
MKLIAYVSFGLLTALGSVMAQSTFVVTGTAIPSTLLQQNYGRLPKDVAAYDLNICNATANKQSIVSSEIYQALTQANVNIQPIGRQIMLAAILRNQSHSKSTVLSLVINSVTGVLSVLSSSKYGPPTGVVAGTALGAIAAQQILTTLKPVLTSDQLEKFDSEVLEAALVLDGGSCVERTVFAAAPKPLAKPNTLKFHVR